MAAKKGAGRVTIKDVAARAGITDMTVSRVVNRSGPVSEAVRKRVQDAIDELGYVPNRLARGLRSNRTHTIALVVTDVTNPFFTTVARGVEDAASDLDHLVLLCNTDESEKEELRYLEMLAGQSVDGVLLVPAMTGQAARELAGRRGLPLVMLDRRVPMTDVSVVRCDSKGGSAEMARYLLGLGHREFAILAGPVGVPTSDDRVAGFLAALEGTDGRATIVHGQFSAESGREGVARALELIPRPTALFALNNFVTIGALQALNERGVRVPEEIVLVGFDDLPPAMVGQPFLTVVSQPAYEMGRRAVDLLLAQLTMPDQAPQEIVLPSELVIRRSSGAPRP
jgi:LacI family transcriptional regulator